MRVDANHYDRSLIDLAGASLADSPVYVQVAIAPFEGAKPSSATGQYLDLFKQYKPDGKSHTYLGVERLLRPGCCSPPPPPAAATT